MIAEAALYRLMTWLSPGYPLGSFSYSHGLEHAVEAGLVHDRATLVAWVETILQRGAGRLDAVFLAEAWRAASARDEAALEEIAEEATAWRGTAEMVLESTAQGAAFLATTRRAWPHPLLDRFAARGRSAPPLAVAVGLAAVAHGVPLAAATTAYLQAFAANLVSAGVRLVPLGQSDGQAAIAALEPLVLDVATQALTTSRDDLGSAAPLADWCSMSHETQYTRLVRS